MIHPAGADEYQASNHNRRRRCQEERLQMAVVFTTHAPSRPIYEELSAFVEDGSKPAGLIVHTATEQADGTVKIVDVWETQEALDAFGERLMKGFEHVGADPSQGPAPEVLQPFRVL